MSLLLRICFTSPKQIIYLKGKSYPLWMLDDVKHDGTSLTIYQPYINPYINPTVESGETHLDSVQHGIHPSS